MKKSIAIFMFIDALGWEILKKHSFLEDLLPYRSAAMMQFGYSCTAIPTILSGKRPTEHKHLSFYYYDPKNSPFKLFKLLKILPPFFDRWRVRHQISKLIKRVKGYTGYFELYSMPFGKLQYFDYIEKKDMFVAKGLWPIKNIADELEERNINYHISNWRLSEEENIKALKKDVKEENIEFAFLYTAAMDSLLHMVTKDGKEIGEKLSWYEDKIRSLVSEVENHYENYSLFVMSDHGMTTLTHEVDVESYIKPLGYKLGKDYMSYYDSTMAHFWFFNKKCRADILKILPTIPHSRLLNDEDKKRYGIDFSDSMYGEEILLMEAGTQIVPSDMGKKSLPGMHGFAPEDKDSDASWLGTDKLDKSPHWVGDYFTVMLDYMNRLVKERNEE